MTERPKLLRLKNDYCFILHSKTDSQGSKNLFWYYRWIGLFVIQKILSNEYFIVRRVNTNKTQILHRIRLKKCTKLALRGQLIRREITAR